MWLSNKIRWSCCACFCLCIRVRDGGWAVRYLLWHFYLCKRSRSDVKSRYSETFRPVMSTRMSPVTTFIRGGRPPTPLGQEKPVPCIEQVHRTGSWTERGRIGGDVTGSKQTKEKSEGGIQKINNTHDSLDFINQVNHEYEWLNYCENSEKQIWQIKLKKCVSVACPLLRPCWHFRTFWTCKNCPIYISATFFSFCLLVFHSKRASVLICCYSLGYLRLRLCENCFSI